MTLDRPCRIPISCSSSRQPDTRRGPEDNGAEKSATLVDLNAQFPLALIGQDGLHPTAEGYQKMAELFQAALTAAYEVPPASGSASTR
jgi:lysophospholipase L1-like esterase